MLFDGKEITGDNPAEIARKGIVRSFQISAIFPQLSVLDNVRIALQRTTGLTFQFWRSDTSLRSLNARAMALLEEVGLAAFAEEITVNLPYGRKRALEIAPPLALEPSVMLLDEPPQGMGHEDVDHVTEQIGRASCRESVCQYV